MDDPDGLLVLPLAHEILRRLKNREGKESDGEHDQGKAANRDHEIAPAEILRSCAVGVCDITSEVA